MHPEILITGATGMVGRELVRLLLERSDSTLHLLLHHNGAGLAPAELLQSTFGIVPNSDYVARLRLHTGDVTTPDLGLAPDDYALLTGVGGIIHAAATTRFDLALDEAQRINVGGARQIVQFALDCSRLERFAFLSTAFVAGRRSGPIAEGELTHDCGFVNTYEQSKYEAEQVIAGVGDRLPVAVYRLSTILGNSRNGHVSHFTAPHQSLYIMYLGLAAMISGDPQGRVDLMPSDYSAEVLFRLFADHFVPGQTYHLTAGAAKSYTLQEIIDESYRYLAELDPGWGRRNYPKPALASDEAFDLFLLSAAQANNPLMQNVVKVLSTFAEQFRYPKRFSTANVLAALPDYETNMPHVRDYYRKVIAYCLATRWRKHD